MKTTSLFLSAAFLGLAPITYLSAQGESADAGTSKETAPSRDDGARTGYQAPASLKALGEEDKRKFFSNLRLAQNLLGKRRIQEALHHLYEAELMVPDYMVVHSLLGNGFVHLRDFEEARKSYAKAQELYPTFSTKFNIAEVEFVSGEFKAAGKLFEELLKDETISEGQKKLISYKNMICLIEQDKGADAEKILKQYSPMDATSPIYFFTKAAMAFHNSNYDEGFGWVEDARVSFQGSVVAVYVDSITEVYSRKDSSGRLQTAGENAIEGDSDSAVPAAESGE